MLCSEGLLCAELVVEGCGRAEPVSESACCVYGCAALRVLALEPRLAARATRAGAVHLAALHLKILNTAVLYNTSALYNKLALGCGSVHVYIGFRDKEHPISYFKNKNNFIPNFSEIGEAV